MKTICRPYTPADFMPVRDMLIETYRAWPKQINWRLERWNYARYMVAPLLARFDDLDAPEGVAEQAGIGWWESHAMVWADAYGRIVALAHAEDPRPGAVWIQRRPGYEFLFPEMLEWAEQNLVSDKGRLLVLVYDYDQPLLDAVWRRGYLMDPKYIEHDAMLRTCDVPPYGLPEGWVIRSVAETGNPAFHAEVKGRAFGHTDPREFVNAYTYREQCKAPDYDPDLDLVVIGSEGQGVAMCGIWVDEHNKIGILEPVGTHPDYRLQGFGREVVYEAARRARARGCNEVWVGTEKTFYQHIGFRPTLTSAAYYKQFGERRLMND